VLIREIAARQVPDRIAQEVFKEYKFPDAHLRYEDTHDKSLDDMARAIATRLGGLASAFRSFDEAGFAKDFKEKCETRSTAFKRDWDQQWRTEADGKRIIEELRNELKIRMPLLKFKKKILREMKSRKSDDWHAVKGLIEEGLKSA